MKKLLLAIFLALTLCLCGKDPNFEYEVRKLYIVDYDYSNKYMLLVDNLSGQYLYVKYRDKWFKDGDVDNCSFLYFLYKDSTYTYLETKYK